MPYRWWSWRVIGTIAAAAAIPAAPSQACAQLSVGGQAIGLVTRISPLLRKESLTEGYLTQPMIMAHGAAIRNLLLLVATLDFEGETLKRGELAPGVYGEGYVDRRHPHTLVHEFVLSARASQASISLGKGFAPFGTDDPMVRPFVKYPANHHHAQILERMVAVGAARFGAFTGELATFNGDEPESPRDSPDVDHFGDSWSARVTAVRHAAELQASFAKVISPENAFGAGLDQHKWSASARFNDPASGRYFLGEWARSDELRDGRLTFRFWTVLAEAAANAGPVRVAARLEQTTRPEEERLLDVFRTPRPLPDVSILGTTRWRIGSVSASSEMRVWRMRVSPLAEASLANLEPVNGRSAFDPSTEVFGSNHVWTLSAGLRLAAGTIHRRMGRYGIADQHSH